MEITDNTPLPLFPSQSKETGSTEQEEQQSTEVGAELSEVDLGLKNQPDFEELISFTHSFNNYQICRCIHTQEELNKTSFPLLLSNEFLLANISLDINELSQSENAASIIAKAKNFRTPQYEMSDKRQFLEKLVEYSKEIGMENTIDFILPIILSIQKESNDLKHMFTHEYSHFLDVFVSFGENAYLILKNQLVQFTLDFLLMNFKDDGLMREISQCFVHLGKLIKQEDFVNEYLSKAIIIARDEKCEKYEKVRAILIQLFCELAMIIPETEKDECTVYIVKEIKTVTYIDSSKLVKDALASKFINVCENVSKDVFIKELIPIYKTHCTENSSIAKKHSISILPRITKLCDTETITSTILPIYIEFSKDKVNSIRNISYEIFGEFLSLLDKKEKDKYISLLDLFINNIQMFREKIPNKDEFEIIKKCAFNFPAVVWFFEKEHWEKMRPCYDILRGFNNEEINICLASSIGELANILGSEITEEYLGNQVKYFFEYDNNNNERTISTYQIKILNALPDVVRNLSPSAKIEYVNYPCKMITHKIKWREKIELCKIIGKYHNIYGDEMTYKRIFPIAINFCFDNVSQVRFESAKNNGKLILQLLSSESIYSSKTMKVLEAFATSLHYNFRQLFILMCTDIFESHSVYEDYIADLLFDLAFDNVANVRITLAKFIAKLIKDNKYKWVKDDEKIKQMIVVLKGDKKKEVSKELEGIEADQGIKVENIENVNAKFTNHMERLLDEFGISQNVPLKSKIKS